MSTRISQILSLLLISLLWIISNSTVIAEELLEILPPQTAINQWSIYDLEFTTGQSYNWDDFPLQVMFTNTETGNELKLDGYWDGGGVWKVRFAPTQPGTWEWQSISADPELSGQTGALQVIAPASDLININPNYRGHLRISSNGRYFEYADGVPFFWLGDTAWHLNTLQMGLEEGSQGRPFYEYLQDRKAKKFTVIQTQFYKFEAESEGGQAFFGNFNDNGNFENLNPAYFQGMDTRMQEVWQQGFVVAGHPSWMSEQDISLTEAQNLSRYILARYGAYNLVWSLSGEYQNGYANDRAEFQSPDRWNSLGNFIQEYNAYQHPVTVHPLPLDRWEKDFPGAGQQSSSGEFHTQAWLTYNWLQTGHRFDNLKNIPFRILQDYSKRPLKPVVLAEAWYENHNRHGEPPTTAQVRWQPWVAFLNGGAGYTYGAVGVAAFYNPEIDPSPPRPWNDTPWYEALVMPAGGQQQFVLEFFSSMDWWALEPRRDWLQVDGQTPLYDYEDGRQDPHLAANPAGSDVVIYIPEGNAGREIIITHLVPQSYTAQWFNPREGSYSTANINNPVTPDDNGQWLVPTRPDAANEDWVLYLTHEALPVPDPTEMPAETPSPTFTPTETPTPTFTPTVTPMPTFTPTPTPTPAIISLAPVADTFVDSGKPKANNGKATSLSVDATPRKITYFKFDLANLSPDQILAAELRLYVTDGINAGQDIKLVGSDWTETGLTFRNQPSSTTVVASGNPVKNKSWLVVDLTSTIQTYAGQTLALAIDTASTDLLKVNSKEAKNNKPHLLLTVGQSVAATPTQEALADFAPEGPTLRLDLPSTVNAGETFEVHVEASNIAGEGLYGVQFELRYDPALISAANLQVNPDLNFVLLSEADNAAGKISLVASRQEYVPGLTGNITLLTFQATAVGTSGPATFSFENEKVSDPQAQAIDVVAQDGTVTIEGSTEPEPTAESTPLPEPTAEPTAEPTSEPAPALILGQVILAGRANNDSSGATVTINGSSQSALTGATGSYSITHVAIGSYPAIMADAPGYISAVCTSPTVAAPETSLLPVTLLAGDVDDNDNVDITDGAAVGASFGLAGSDLAADLTGDDIVDILDIVLVNLNFGQTGPQAWLCQ